MEFSVFLGNIIVPLAMVTVFTVVMVKSLPAFKKASNPDKSELKEINRRILDLQLLNDCFVNETDLDVEYVLDDSGEPDVHLVFSKKEPFLSVYQDSNVVELYGQEIKTLCGILRMVTYSPEAEMLINGEKLLDKEK